MQWKVFRLYPSGREAERRYVQRWCMFTGPRAKLQEHNYQFGRGKWLLRNIWMLVCIMEGGRCVVDKFTELHDQGICAFFPTPKPFYCITGVVVM